jgi:hypothetical protein
MFAQDKHRSQRHDDENESEQRLHYTQIAVSQQNDIKQSRSHRHTGTVDPISLPGNLTASLEPALY